MLAKRTEARPARQRGGHGRMAEAEAEAEACSCLIDLVTGR